MYKENPLSPAKLKMKEINNQIIADLHEKCTDDLLKQANIADLNRTKTRILSPKGALSPVSGSSK